MDGVGDQLLAGAGLAADQDRGGPLGDLADLLEDQAHGLGAPDDAVEAVDAFDLAAELVALLAQRGLLGLDPAGEADRLADEVGDHGEEAGARVEQAVGDGRLGGEHPERCAFTAPDGHADEGQFRMVAVEAVEKPRFIGEAGDDPGLVALEDAPDHTLAGAVADALAGVGVAAVVHGADGEFATLLVEQGGESVGEAAALVEHAQDLAQGLAQVERTAEHAGDLVERGQLGLEQVQPGCLGGADLHLRFGSHRALLVRGGSGEGEADTAAVAVVGIDDDGAAVGADDLLR